MPPAWVVRLPDSLWQLGIGHRGTVEFTFEHYMTSARLIKKPAQFLPVVFRLQYDFYPSGLIRTGGIIQRPYCQPSVTHPAFIYARDTNIYTVALGHFPP